LHHSDGKDLKICLLFLLILIHRVRKYIDAKVITIRYINVEWKYQASTSDVKSLYV